MSAAEHFSDSVIRKARKIPAREVTPNPHDPTTTTVRSTRTGRQHEVHLLLEDGVVVYRTCTCTNGNKRGGQAECYHAASAELRYEQDHETAHEGGRDRGGPGMMTESQEQGQEQGVEVRLAATLARE